ncbi:hypothetical protein HPB47_010549 [Ixodes persulcatus]|uniref:Uncharacterized protein n=1 Tax=Ixodes persulcatus TaxID=34615 RepID=A0AC60QZZ2_IXOPE|nr:hypothetical protein HPB47_010549 [Ixodes persulcatus]
MRPLLWWISGYPQYCLGREMLGAFAVGADGEWPVDAGLGQEMFSQIAAVAVRLLPYSDRNARGLFFQAVLQFHLAGIASLARTFRDIVYNLFATAEDEVYHALSYPLLTIPYAQINALLLQKPKLPNFPATSNYSQQRNSEIEVSKLVRRMTLLLGVRAHTINDVLLQEL